MSEHLSSLDAKDIPRRQFLNRAWQLGVGIAGMKAIDQSPRAIVEAQIPWLRENSQSEVLFTSVQERRLPNADLVCLFVGGATTRDSHDLAAAITPSLEQLGSVGYVRYAHSSLDTDSLAESINALEKPELAVYGHSLGTHVFGKLLPKLDNGIRITDLFLDCTPPSLAYTDHATFAQILEQSPWDDSSIVAAAANIFTYGNPVKSETAPPGLLWDQLEIQRDGEKYLGRLAARVRRDRTHVSLLRPKDPDKDTVVDSLAAEHRLYEFFPSMQVHLLRGNQGHANTTDNPSGYNQAIREAIAHHVQKY